MLIGVDIFILGVPHQEAPALGGSFITGLIRWGPVHVGGQPIGGACSRGRMQQAAHAFND